ncbi:major facilitator superfamily domain-containing protein [Schizophyllum amplum]|uniref:Major facilitator superfamily domain-containing protein n=1 Tax=Schizophyllum amplum TaxID=97359 RepID=A0A550CCG2_9AGAR|nr:major facilitator superfamily domain-containing protein [Auriculariopsis ampla]
MSVERAPLLPSGQEQSYTEPAPSRPEAEDVESAAPGEVKKPAMVTIIVPMIVGIFLAATDTTIVASAYAAIGNDFKQLQNANWIATGYMLTATSSQALYGKLSDIFGRKACLLSAYSVFALGCLCCGLARNMTELIAARAFAGAGGGGMTTCAL